MTRVLRLPRKFFGGRAILAYDATRQLATPRVIRSFARPAVRVESFSLSWPAAHDLPTSGRGAKRRNVLVSLRPASIVRVGAHTWPAGENVPVAHQALGV